MVEGGYPVYQRRSENQGGQVFEIEKNNHTWTVDNGWVIPYISLLSLLFNGHINIEVVYTVKSVKYIYKYIAKGT